MRYLFLIVDASRSMADKDLKPDRIRCTLKIVENFLAEFFDQNPISQVGLIITRDGRAEKLLELNGNSRVLMEALKRPPSCSGDPSIQNSLEMTMRALKHVPNHASKEAVIIMGSIASCDPGNIFSTIDELVKQSIRCCIVGLSAEVRLCKTISQKTQGTYQVITDEIHFRDIMLQHCRPPPAKANAEATMIKMGFPKHLVNGPMAACLCHLDQRSIDHVTTSGYFCPRCSSKYCELPVMCKVCGLTLVLAPHLARSYHHLFPLPMFRETVLTEKLSCTGCQVIVSNKGYKCPECEQLFCIDCDLYVHETLHNCPGCVSSVKVQDTTIIS
ncbi:general transcription factor IIH subunit 2-like isoform X2 [Halichondria panicea]